jgi:hypothetical protein
MAIETGPETMSRPQRNDVSVKVDARVYKYARKLAALKELRLAEYLSLVLAEGVDRDWKDMQGEKLNLLLTIRKEMEDEAE